MTLEQLVPTLEVCQQLKAAGFPQDTAMVWFSYGEKYEPELLKRNAALLLSHNIPEVLNIAAPTAGELEEWLRVRRPNASMTISSCNGDVPTVNVDIDDDVVGLHKGVGQYRTLVAALAALVLEVAG